MKEIITDTYDFEKLRRSNALYVDKTQYVWQLVSSATSIYFLSRPRRFGKSLLLSTLEAFFLNKRELFQGLAIERLAPADFWQEWPVIHLDMAQASSKKGLDETRRAMDFYLRREAAKLGMTVEEGWTASETFQTLIDYMQEKSGGKQVVVLVDEYDKPILDALHTPYVDKVVGMMQDFYQIVKSNVANERFVFLTGVSKFSHTSLFSGFNNPTDISQRTDYAAMLGYTEQELRDNFAEYIDLTATKLDMGREALIDKMKLWYDGFRFTSDAAHVFNPVSVGKFFQNGGDFENYWYSTGTPTFLVELMRTNPFQMDELTGRWVSPMLFANSDATSVDPFAMAIQTGYLTIKDVNYDFGKAYRYDFPNEEIRQSWNNDMMRVITAGQVHLEGERLNMLMALRDGDTRRLMERLGWMFAGVTKENLGKVNEGYYRNLIYLVFTAMGVPVHAEEQVAGGRVDLIVAGYGSAYVLELKVSRRGTEADVQRLLAEGIDQALTRRYADKYRLEGHTLHLVSVVFDHQSHQLVAWREHPAQ